MDDQQARAEEVVRAELVRSGMPGRPNALARQIVEALAALPVAPEQPTQANEVVVAKLLRERISDLRDNSWVTMDYQVGFEAGARAALVSSPSVETVTPDKETIADPIPRYAQLDVWMALHGTDFSVEFEAYREQHGYAETWARLMGGVRENASYKELHSGAADAHRETVIREVIDWFAPRAGCSIAASSAREHFGVSS